MNRTVCGVAIGIALGIGALPVWSQANSSSRSLLKGAAVEYLYPEQVTVSADLIGEAVDLMKDNLPCTVLFFNERPVDISLPTFVFLEVTASEPGVRGDTSGNVQKPATVETGAEVMVPLFIRIGDLIKIDTRSHEYVERVNKT